MGNVDIPFDAIWCPICTRQIVPRRIIVPRIQSQNPPPVLPQANLTCHSRLPVVSTSCPGLDSRASESLTIPAPKHALRLRHRTVIDPAPIPLYCSEECRLADLHSYHGPINSARPDRCGSFPPTPPSSGSDLNCHGSHGSDTRGVSFKTCPSVLSLAPIAAATTTVVTAAASATGVSPSTKDYGADAYSQLSAIYGFAPLPPPAPFVPKAAPVKSPPPMEGGVMMAASRIQAALCTKTVKLVWGRPVDTNPEDDNKPIPGWTDGSNAWRASTYGFAPPYDFTRTEPDEAAIRAYGSYVATPHRSRGVHSTLGQNKPTDAVKTGSSSQPPSTPLMDLATQKLYQRFFASITERCRSRRQASIHPRAISLSASHAGLTHSCLVREVSLVEPGAEGCLIVPDVKLRRTTRRVFSMVGSHEPSTACDATRSVPPISTPRLTSYPQSYASKTFLYPIMQTPLKKEKRVEWRLVNGVRCEVEVEVEIEKPVKRLFLFGGARDVW